MKKDYISEYIDYLSFEKKLSTNSVLSYENDLFIFAQNVGEVIDVDEDIIRNFIYNLNSSTKTKAHYLSVMKSFYNFLVGEGYIDKNPVDSLKIPKTEKNLPVYLSIEEIELILDIPQRNTLDVRNKAFLEVMYATGLRISELSNLRIQDIDLNDCVLRVVGKGSKERIVPINEVAIDYLQIYLNDARISLLKGRNSEFVFINRSANKITRQGFFKIIKSRVLEVGIKKDVSPHTFRHSFATHLLNNGADLRVIQELLGHEHLITTEIYSHVSSKKIKDDYSNHPHA